MAAPELVARIEMWGALVNIVTVNSRVVQTPSGTFEIYTTGDEPQPKPCVVALTESGRKFK